MVLHGKTGIRSKPESLCGLNLFWTKVMMLMNMYDDDAFEDKDDNQEDGGVDVD